MDVPTPDKLRTVFEQKHSCFTAPDGHENDGVPYPSEMEEAYCYEDATRTWLLHPTPLSSMALEYVFENRSSYFSPYSADLLLHLAPLEQAFVLYAVCDILSIIENKFPLFLTVEAGEDEAETMFRVKEKMAVVTDCMERVNFFGRLRCLRGGFVRAMRYSMTLGVIPVLVSQRESDMSSTMEELVDSPLDVLGVVQNYLKVFEVMSERLRVIDEVTLVKNTLLTVKDGVYSCTDMTGETEYRLWSFAEKTSFVPGTLLRPPLMDMMQHEAMYACANRRSQDQTFEKMLQTKVVVSSGFSQEVDAIVKESLTKGILDPVQMMKEVEKEARQLTALKMKAQALKKATEGSGQEGAESSRDEHDYSREFAELEAGLDIAGRAEKAMLRVTGLGLEGPIAGDANVVGQLMDPVLDERRVPVIVQDSGLIHGGHEEERREVDQGRRRALQDKLLLVELNNCKRNKTELKREVITLRKEVLSLIEHSAVMDYQLRLKQIKIVATEQRQKEAERDRDRYKDSLLKYEDLVQTMERSVEKIVKETRGGEEERRKLKELFTFSHDPQLSMDSRFSRIMHANKLKDFLSHVVGNGVPLQNTALREKRAERSPFRYRELMKNLRLSCVPYFSEVTRRTTLDSYNFTLPYCWMHDTVIPGCRMEDEWAEDAAGRQAVTITPELYVLDVNPKTPQEVERVRKAVEASSSKTLLDSVFHKNFLNVQFPVQGNVEGTVNAGVKEKWRCLCNTLFSLTGEKFTKNGQRVGAHVSHVTVEKYVAPFIAQYVGTRGNSSRLSSFVSVYMISLQAQEDTDEHDGRTQYEKLIFSYLKKKCKFVKTKGI